MSHNNDIRNSSPLAWESLVQWTIDLQKTEVPAERVHLNQAIHELVQDRLPQLREELDSLDMEQYGALDWHLFRVKDQFEQQDDVDAFTRLLDEKRENLEIAGSSSQPFSVLQLATLFGEKITRNSLSGLLPQYIDYRDTQIFPSDLYRLPEETRQQVLSCLDTETMLELYHNRTLSKLEFQMDRPHWFIRAERWGRVPGDKNISAFDYVKQIVCWLKELQKRGFLSPEHSKLSPFKLAEVLSSHDQGNLLPSVCPWMKPKDSKATAVNLLPGLSPKLATELLLSLDPSDERNEMLMRLAALHGGNVHVCRDDGSTPIHRAAGEGRSDLLKALLFAGAYVSAASNSGTTPLHWAILDGHLDCVKVLLAAKADVNAASIEGVTPLHIASEKAHLNCLKTLLDAQADINAAMDQGATPLHMASSEGHLACVKTLLMARADVNAKVSGWLTPLQVASHLRHEACVNALKEASAER